MASNPLLELAGAPGSGTSRFVTGNFGSRPGQRPAGQPRIPASKAQRIALARLAAILAAGHGGGSLQKMFLP